MGVAASLLLFAAGAILRWAVTASATGLRLHTVGVILMIVAGVGLLVSLIYWGTWGGIHPRDPRPTGIDNERDAMAASDLAEPIYAHMYRPSTKERP